MHGYVNGRIGDTWVPLVAQMTELEPNILRIAAVYAQYQVDPSVLNTFERGLVEVSLDLAERRSSMTVAYGRALDVISAARIDDRDIYRQVLSRLYGSSVAGG